MNLLTLKRFKNELIIFMALLFVAFSLFYKFSAQERVALEKKEMEASIVEISKVSELKSFWNSKKIKKEANKFKTIVAKNKVKRFEKRSRKLVAIYKDLSVKELNTISKKLLITHFEITKLDISQSGKDRFNMEFTCKW
jgi:hypothetical protein